MQHNLIYANLYILWNAFQIGKLFKLCELITSIKKQKCL